VPPAIVVVAPALPAPELSPFEDSFFAKDPPLDGLEPSEAWVFRQESWNGGFGENKWTQHCHELGYPASLRDRIALEANEGLQRRGIQGRLPETTRRDHLVEALGDFTDRLMPPAEPLVKFLFCTEHVRPAAEQHRAFETLGKLPLAQGLAFGTPTGVWKREYADHRKEFGFQWLSVTPEAVEAAFSARGYVKSEEPATRTTIWSLGREAMARTHDRQLYWFGIW
jgi:hypothetical protein